MLLRKRVEEALLLIAGLTIVSCTGGTDTPTKWSSGSVVSPDGVAISYQVGGNGPISLVFVHGWGCDRSYWKEQLDHFSETNKVVAIDLAGHGESDANRGAWTMEAFGRDVAAVVNGLELGPVVLVGHSMGSPVVMEAAQLLGDRVIGVVPVDGFYDLDAVLTPAEVDEFLAPVFEDYSSAVTAFVAGMFLPGSDPEMVEWIVEDMSSTPPGIGIETSRNSLLWIGQRAEKTFGRGGFPIRAINSDRNPTNVESAERHGMEVVLMSGVGHFVMLEDPETFNALLTEAIADFSG